VERCEEKVAGAVAGEKASCPVRAVGGGGKPEDDDAGLRIAESGDGKPPVGLVLEGSPLLPGDLLAPSHQTRAATTGDDLPL
jgi:hypothetical protein